MVQGEDVQQVIALAPVPRLHDTGDLGREGCVARDGALGAAGRAGRIEHHGAAVGVDVLEGCENRGVSGLGAERLEGNFHNGHGLSRVFTRSQLLGARPIGRIAHDQRAVRVVDEVALFRQRQPRENREREPARGPRGQQRERDEIALAQQEGDARLVPCQREGGGGLQCGPERDNVRRELAVAYAQAVRDVDDGGRGRRGGRPRRDAVQEREGQERHRA
jgi:hypothetical protein